MNWDTSATDLKTINAIVDRAMELIERVGVKADRMTVSMDITAVHSNGCPLQLSGFLASDDANFAHDVFGIMQHINRDTGGLRDCFLPRFSA